MGTPCIFQKECRQAHPAGRANTPARRVELCIVGDHETSFFLSANAKKPGLQIEAPVYTRLLFLFTWFVHAARRFVSWQGAHLNLERATESAFGYFQQIFPVRK